MRTALLAVVGLVAALPATPRAATAQRRPHRTAEEWLADCRSRDEDDRARACEIRELGFRPAGRTIHLDASPNGGVVIASWDRDSVHVRALVQASARTDSDAAALLRGIHVSVSGATVTSDGPETGRREGWAVSYEVRLPRRSDVRAETVNGPVSAEEVSGRLDLETVNGPLTLSALAGEVHARATNGPLTVELTGARWDGAGLDAETHNGPATLTIPDGYSAQLETGTVNGPMRVDIPITVQGRLNRLTRITTTLGAGGPPVRVVTTNGPLAVRRR
jgi:DUF4097 and DUF4098 domain-containing protein YvlB